MLRTAGQIPAHPLLTGVTNLLATDLLTDFLLGSPNGSGQLRVASVKHHCVTPASGAVVMLLFIKT
jgi:hypothetical protein